MASPIYENSTVKTSPAPGVSVGDVTWNPDESFNNNGSGAQDVTLGTHAVPRTKIE